MARPALALTVAVLLAACTGSPSSTDAAASRAPGSGDRSLLYTCGSSDPFLSTLFDDPATDLTRTPPGRAVHAVAAEDPFLAEAGWHLAGSDVESATFVAWMPRAEAFAYARATLEGTAWRVDEWGGCIPRVWEPGASAADWMLAPSQRLTPMTTSFAVDVTERACAGGQSSAGRIKPPIVVYQADAILVAFTVHPLPGGHTCPANPATRVVVELREPVGARQVLDAGTLPPSVRD